MEMKTLKDVERALRRGTNVTPLVREIPADTVTPVAAFLRLADRKSPSFLLESVEGGERLARYSFLGTRPFETLLVRDGAALSRDASGRQTPLPGNPFMALGRRLAQFKAAPEPGLPRFTGGAVGTIGYEMVRHLEPSVRLRAGEGPEAKLFLFKNLVAFDHVRHRMLLIANVERRSGVSLGRAYRQACVALDEMEARLSKPGPERPLASGGSAAGLEPKAALGKAAFKAGVERLKGNIRAGDIFQVVLSDRFEVPLKSEPFAVYRSLRAINPSPYMFYVGDSNEAALGASPEMLVRVENGIVETRPIAGTRPRGRDEEEDRRHEKNLLASVKERAEHVMLVDLGRNDVGRVSRPGTVEVPAYGHVERYSHVMHLVSSVRGKLKPGMTPWDAFAACFPAGTVSGAPKIRAMQLLSELEPVARGLYAGAVVYSGFTGSLDSAIAIRSLSVLRSGGRRVARFQAGAGIVADSRPEREHDEILNKSRAMREAIRRAEAAA
ncbi:MAG: chorismate-binding protein [Proteobacteria bacterium]|nr:chorismate-binding protein [Pseudomonadota bacterium]